MRVPRGRPIGGVSLSVVGGMTLRGWVPRGLSIGGRP